MIFNIAGIEKMWKMWIRRAKKWVMHRKNRLWKRVIHSNTHVKSRILNEIMEKSRSYQQVINKLWITFPPCITQGANVEKLKKTVDSPVFPEYLKKTA